MNEHTSEILWRVESDPFVLLDDLYPQRTPGSAQRQDRKCRLYLVACARRQWGRLPGVCRDLVELAEYVAESPREREALRGGLAPIAEHLMHSDGEARDLRAAETELSLLLGAAPMAGAFNWLRSRGAPDGPGPLGPDDWHRLAPLVYLPFVQQAPPFRWVAAELHSIALLREVYYNPYLFIPFPAAWRTTEVLSVARHMYDTGEFGAMPVLADALQEAGCEDDSDIVKHCRDPEQVHVRGCWVLDLVLARG